MWRLTPLGASARLSLTSNNGMKRLLAIVVMMIGGCWLMAQPLHPIAWHIAVEEKGGEEAEVVFTATLEVGWHLYSQHTDPVGPQPTVFSFAPSETYSLKGEVEEVTPAVEEMDEMFGCVVKSFAGKAEFRQRVVCRLDEPFTLTGSINYQLCGNGMCIAPEDYDFAVSIAGRRTSTEAEEVAADEEVAVGVDSVQEMVEAGESEHVGGKHIESTTDVNPRRSLLAYFLLALGGGILTMFTPCVFPMIPMTVNFFLRNGENRKKGRRQAWFFGFSIVAIFAVLGVVLSLIFGPELLNTIATHWIPNVVFFAIFMAFALSFLGLFELRMPSKWVNGADSQSERGDWLAPFFIALTTVLVSFSCTGPIIGGALAGLTSVAGAHHTGRWVSLISMLGFGVGFALPFTLLAFFPQLLKNMRSGDWLHTVKVSFAFLELAFGLKFLQMADIDAGWGLLPRDIYLSLWIVIFGLWGVYLLGGLRLKGDADTRGIGVGRLLVAVVDLAFVVYMIPGLWGAELKGLSGFLPPMSSQQFNLKVQVESGDSSAVAYLPPHRRYAEQLSKFTPPGYEVFYDIDEAMAYAQNVGKPLFVEFTGKNCANCREMEHYVWADEAVRELLGKKYVICSLFTDENAVSLPEQEWVIDDKGRTLKTLGRRNSYYQRQTYNMNAQPYYVLLDTHGNTLTRENYQYNRDVQHFLAWLNEGLINFEK